MVICPPLIVIPLSVPAAIFSATTPSWLIAVVHFHEEDVAGLDVRGPLPNKIPFSFIHTALVVVALVVLFISQMPSESNSTLPPAPFICALVALITPFRSVASRATPEDVFLVTESKSLRTEETSEETELMLSSISSSVSPRFLPLLM